MRRYIFATTFATPQEGPRFDLVAPFDKVEVVQGEASIYPTPDTVLVSIECQAHSALVDATDEAGLPIAPDPMLLADLEARMTAGVTLLSTRYKFVGQEDY